MALRVVAPSVVPYSLFFLNSQLDRIILTCSLASFLYPSGSCRFTFHLALIVIALSDLEPITVPTPQRLAVLLPLTMAAYLTRFSPAMPIQAVRTPSPCCRESQSWVYTVSLPHSSQASLLCAPSESI